MQVQHRISGTAIRCHCVRLTLCGVSLPQCVHRYIHGSPTLKSEITAPLGPTEFSCHLFSPEGFTGEPFPTFLTSYMPHHQHQHPRSWSHEAGQEQDDLSCSGPHRILSVTAIRCQSAPNILWDVPSSCLPLQLKSWVIPEMSDLVTWLHSCSSIGE